MFERRKLVHERRHLLDLSSAGMAHRIASRRIAVPAPRVYSAALRTNLDVEVHFERANTIDSGRSLRFVVHFLSGQPERSDQIGSAAHSQESTRRQQLIANSSAVNRRGSVRWGRR
jgi:hypothetical protein